MRENSLTEWYCPCGDESTEGWVGFASVLWRAFASYGRICGTRIEKCQCALLQMEKACEEGEVFTGILIIGRSLSGCRYGA